MRVCRQTAEAPKSPDLILALEKPRGSHDDACAVPGWRTGLRRVVMNEERSGFSLGSGGGTGILPAMATLLKRTPVAVSFLIPAVLLVLMPATASAHTETGAVGGFLSGFHHPLTGLDHIVAMVAVGLWGAFLAGRAMWLLPVVFPAVMAFGGALGVLGVPLPGVEAGIALSGIVLGLMVALAAKPPLWVAAAIVGIFAIFHGHAHGTELPHAANPMTYAVGFVISTGLLHLAGISFGLLTKWPAGRIFIRTAGVAIAMVGSGFLFKFL